MINAMPLTQPTYPEDLMTEPQRVEALLNHAPQTIPRLLALGESPLSMIRMVFEEAKRSESPGALYPFTWTLRSLKYFPGEIPGLHRFVADEIRKDSVDINIPNYLMAIAIDKRDPEIDSVRGVFFLRISQIVDQPPDYLLTREIFDELSGLGVKVWHTTSRLAFDYAKPEVIDHVIKLMSDETSKIIQNCKNDPEEFSQWIYFVRYLLMSSDRGSEKHSVAMENLIRMIKASDGSAQESEYIGSYKVEDEAIIDLLYELSEPQTISRISSFSSWILEEYGPKTKLIEDKWFIRLESMIKKACDLVRNSTDPRIIREVSDISKMLEKLIEKKAGKPNGMIGEATFANTDWPLRIAKHLYGVTDNPNQLIHPRKILSIRNVCSGGLESDIWFAAFVLRESLLDEKKGPSFGYIRMSPFFKCNECRSFSVENYHGPGLPLWETALQRLNIPEAVINRFKVAMTMMSVDFSDMENNGLAMDMFASPEMVIPASLEVNLDGLDPDFFLAQK